MPRTAILIGDAATCGRLQQQLDLMAAEKRPVTLGWVLVRREPGVDEACPILGTIEHLESIVARRPPALALLSLPAAAKDLIASIRTRLRRLNVPDRFVPTLEDLVEGIGPRTEIDIDLAQLLDRPPRHMDEAAVRSVIADKRIAITGAGGSISGELARIVARFEPAELLLIERSENALFEIDRQVARCHPEVRRRALLHDVVESRRTLDLFAGIRPQVIFHAAAHKHVPMMEDHPRAAIDNNLFGTVAVADAARECGAERMVFISTDKAVNPRSIMGASKRLAELYVQHLNAQHSQTSYSIVRFGNVLGSSGSALEIWARQIADGGPVTVTDPRMTRYFMTIPEAASLVIQAAALASIEGGVFLLDMGEPVKIVDLARRFIELHGLTPSPSQPPGAMPIIFTGVRPGEKLHEDLAFDAEAMRPTRHPDINAWMLPPPPPEFVAEMLRDLATQEGRRESESELTARIWTLLERAHAGLAIV